jgi:hypothetical protein
MHIFRTRAFRKLASMLALSLLLGSSASVWASLDNLLDNKQMESAACHMQMQDKQPVAGNCCTDNSDCMNLCGNCSVPVTVSVLANSIAPALEFIYKALHFTLSNNIPDGTSEGLLYRPPIFRA